MTAKERDRRKEIESKCPPGYSLHIGQPIDMLDITELWRIFENHDEPHRTRIPQDLIDVAGIPCTARVPKSWGRCLYYKVV
jgi:hypothetical protein